MLEKLMRKKTAGTSQLLSERIRQVKKNHIPTHVAIIMDGNGRWAKKRGLPRVAGHHEGMKTVRKITRTANDLGVKALTLYAFSTENWKRPKLEIDFLMKLPGEFLTTYLPELIEQNVKVEMIGNFDVLPDHTKLAIEKAMKQTATNTGLVLNFAMNYGSRLELTESMQRIAQAVAGGHLQPEAITEETITEHLMTAHLPEPDLLIRTSGEVRLSNFMLWQLAYAEFIFTETLWPDFNEEHLVDTIVEFQKRSRRFGSLEEGEESR